MQIEINYDIADQITLKNLRETRERVLRGNTAIWSYDPLEESRARASFINSIDQVIDWFKAY
jgi:hypothetical protein